MTRDNGAHRGGTWISSRPTRVLGLLLLGVGALACGGGANLGGFGSGGTGGGFGADIGTGGTFPGVGGSIGDLPTPTFGDTVQAKTTPTPLSGGTLRLSKSGDHVYVSDPDRNQVSVVDLSSSVATPVTQTFSFGPLDEPGRLVEGPAGKLFVALRRSGELATLDLLTGAVTRQGICGAPRGLAYDDANATLYVACEDGTLAMVGADGKTSAVTLEKDLRDVVLSGDKVLVSKLRTAELIACDKTGKMLGKVRAPAILSKNLRDAQPFEATIAWRTDVTPDGRVVMVHQRASTGSVMTGRPGGYGGLTCNSNIVHTALTTFDPESMKPTTTTMPFGRAVLPVDFTYVADRDLFAVVAAGNAHTKGLSSFFLVSAKQTLTIPAEVASAQVFDITSVRPSLPGAGGTAGAASMGAAGGAVGIGGAGGSAGAGGAGGTAAAGGAGGALVDAATGRGGRDMVAGSGGSGGRASPTLPMIPGGPTCLDDMSTGLNTEGEPVAVVYSSKLKVIVLQSRQPAELLIYQSSGTLLSVVPLADTTDVTDTGFAIFHSNAGGSIACASCHAEGAEDGHVWNFSETGPRRTQSLRGGVKGTEPFHWDGDMTDLDMIMDKVFVGRMSGPVLATDQKAALGHFVDSIPSLPTPPIKDMASVMRGKALFDDVGKASCASCHSGSLLTNNTTVDVGTGAAFQVPSLRGVMWRTPLMHNGCAATLADRFDPACGGNAHGNTANLSAQDKADLVAYLQTL